VPCSPRPLGVGHRSRLCRDRTARPQRRTRTAAAISGCSLSGPTGPALAKAPATGCCRVTRTAHLASLPPGRSISPTAGARRARPATSPGRSAAGRVASGRRDCRAPGKYNGRSGHADGHRPASRWSWRWLTDNGAVGGTTSAGWRRHRPLSGPGGAPPDAARHSGRETLRDVPPTLFCGAARCGPGEKRAALWKMPPGRRAVAVDAGRGSAEISVTRRRSDRRPLTRHRCGSCGTVIEVSAVHRPRRAARHRATATLCRAGLHAGQVHP